MLGKISKKAKKAVQEHSSKNNSDSQNNNSSGGGNNGGGNNGDSSKHNNLTVAINKKGGVALNYILKRAPNLLPAVATTVKLLPKITKKDKKNNQRHIHHNFDHTNNTINNHNGIHQNHQNIDDHDNDDNSSDHLSVASYLVNNKALSPAQRRGIKRTLYHDYDILSIFKSSSPSNRNDVPEINILPVDTTNNNTSNGRRPHSRSNNNFPIIKEGYLNKKIDFDTKSFSSSPSSGWKVYRVVLRGSKLYFYKPPSESVLKTFFPNNDDLNNIRDLKFSIFSSNDDHGMDLNPANFESSANKLIFEVCKRKWVRYTAANLRPIMDAMETPTSNQDWDSKSFNSTRVIQDPTQDQNPYIPTSYSPYIAPLSQSPYINSFSNRPNDDASSLKSFSSTLRAFIMPNNESKSIWISKLWDAKKASLRKLIKLPDKVDSNLRQYGSSRDNNNSSTGGNSGGSNKIEFANLPTPRKARAYWGTDKHPELIENVVDRSSKVFEIDNNNVNDDNENSFDDKSSKITEIRDDSGDNDGGDDDKSDKSSEFKDEEENIDDESGKIIDNNDEDGKIIENIESANNDKSEKIVENIVNGDSNEIKDIDNENDGEDENNESIDIVGKDENLENSDDDRNSLKATDEIGKDFDEDSSTKSPTTLVDDSTFNSPIKKSSQKMIRGGSIDALIHELVFESQKGADDDDEFLHAFLLTYPLFIESTHILRELRRCSSMITPKADVINNRLIVIFKTWCQSYTRDLVRDDFWNDILNSVEEIFPDNEKVQGAMELKNLLHEKRNEVLQSSSSMPISLSTPTTITTNSDDSEEEKHKAISDNQIVDPLSLDLSNLLVTGLTPGLFLKIAPEELAKQIYSYHYIELHRLNPKNNLRSFMSLKHRPNSPTPYKENPLNFTQTSPHFITRLIYHHVLIAAQQSAAYSSRRHLILMHWIKVGIKCKELGDMASWMAIVVAVCSPSIVRLKETWSRVDDNLRSIIINDWIPLMSSFGGLEGEIDYINNPKTPPLTLLPDKKENLKTKPIPYFGFVTVALEKLSTNVPAFIDKSSSLSPGEDFNFNGNYTNANNNSSSRVSSRNNSMTGTNTINFEKYWKIYDTIINSLSQWQQFDDIQETSSILDPWQFFDSSLSAIRKSLDPAFESQDEKLAQSIDKVVSDSVPSSLYENSKDNFMEQKKQNEQPKLLGKQLRHHHHRPRTKSKVETFLIHAVRPISVVANTITNTLNPGYASNLRNQQRSQQSFKPILVINLINSEIIPENNLSLDFVFRIISEEGGQYLFQAFNFDDMNDWIKVIKGAEKQGAEKRQTIFETEPIIRIEEEEISHEAGSRNSNLETLMIDGNIPTLVERCIAEIEKREVGIYRVPGAKNLIERLTEEFNNDVDAVDLSSETYSDINVVASVLKLFFRSLPEPLMTYELYEEFVNASKIKDHDERFYAIKDLLYKLPRANYNLLKRLIEHLETVTDCEEVNHMYAGNLALVFTPNILKSRDFIVSMGNLGHNSDIIKCLILHYHWFFDVEREVEEVGDNGEIEEGIVREGEDVEEVEIEEMDGFDVETSDMNSSLAR
nr:8886_t:CDS:10 [Entrophospora candida]